MFFSSQEEFEKAQEQAAMEHTRLVLQTRSDIKDLMSHMSVPDLVTFKKVLHTIVALEADGIKVAAFLEGQCSALLTYVHEVCPGCGKDHAQEALEDILTKDTIECAINDEKPLPGVAEGESE